ncbi:MAG: lipoyl(octanoyl) transferase LipB [Kiritimatiellia bacterium]|nr:lipoyl(octanoyl) transferase LipB [Kiritimatiellia bacterium]MDD4175118.1 lipoyl(octanoyl) transferase LipB [Kiritimatiellia bacterium]MDD4443340.1 lipoyl(octanoyl) transferase LipB [Kiritimatiellia bacterium]MDX9794422.1 lipoyl(octanoyl) transferase LipB [Kiritimatiellia bacterium]NLC81110.1 lipoyl(octanoyl) transferase LipB [Lentisphaerota bacterium]
MRTLRVMDLGGDTGYLEVLALQEQVHAQRVAGQCPDTLLLLEHRPVYTLGRSAAVSHVLYSEEHLRAAGIERVETTRGGDVTYHGPGQLVGYPMLHLGEAGLRVLEYIDALEESLIRAVSAFGVVAGRDTRNRGVWVGDAKLAALGIRVAHQVTMHGFALNVAPRMDDYRGIVACGLQDAGVTSLALLLGEPPDMAAVKRQVERSFRDVFGYEESE